MTVLHQKERARLREITLEVLDELRQSFPLQQRIETASTSVRAAYVQVLQQWCTPPQHDSGPLRVERALLEALVEMDAVVPQAGGWGCYPFSVDATDFRVDLVDGREVHAFCAIDALAIPRLLGHAARIASHCTTCGQALHCDMTANGALPHQPLDQLVVVWGQQGRMATDEICCRTLCPHIRLMCVSCADAAQSCTLALPQAAYVAHAFFAFQGRMLDKRKAASARDSGNV
ncbi:organomercurial lyase [Rhodanobacter sp. OR444]|uniref:organomercurial lyase n=1 Tax=Rhodanobacter sp. OR444 TaxID=1076525 RepID=UPI0009DC426F|nr:organomercurial lyase [Rhodanobacter sp. OR444]